MKPRGEAGALVVEFLGVFALTFVGAGTIVGTEGRTSCLSRSRMDSQSR